MCVCWCCATGSKSSMMGNEAVICQLSCSSLVLTGNAWQDFLHLLNTLIVNQRGKSYSVQLMPSGWNLTASSERSAAVARYHRGLWNAWCLLLGGSVFCELMFCRDGRYFYFIPKTAWYIFRVHKIQTHFLFEINHSWTQLFFLFFFWNSNKWNTHLV